jgi:hypothetical protein
MSIVIDYQPVDDGITGLPSVPVSDIVARAGNMLLDDAHVRWGVPEIIRWINEAMGAIAHLRPDAFAHTGVMTLVAGTYQSLPNGSMLLLDVTRNIGADGATPGRAIRTTDRKSLDDANPDWHGLPQSGTIRHFMHDPRTPKAFYVYPPALASTKIEIKHVVLPAEVVAETDVLPIGLEYIGPVVNYVCYRCNLKDSEFANAQVGSLFYQAFKSSLGLSDASAAAAA